MISVLYVDDEPALLELGKQFLEKDRMFVVDTASSARIALTQLKTERYDVIISDYQMPEMDGIAFLKHLKASGNPTPFIIFTGRGREEVVIEALNEGADFYLQKGGDPKSQFAELAHKIRHAISRREAISALRKSERDYRHLIDNANEAIYVVQDGMIRMANPRLVEMTGYSEQELTSLPMTTFIHPEDRAMVDGRYERRISGEDIPSRYIFRLFQKDRTVRWVELSVVVISWDERPAVLVFLNDITERKITEDALREREERYRQFFKTTLDCVFITTPDGRWIDFNDALVEMFGYADRDEMFRIPVPSIYAYPEERAAFLKIVEREGYVKERPLKFRKRDGTVFDSLITIVPLKNPDGTLKAFIGTFRDITERKRAEEALRESEERYRQFFKTTRDSVFITTPGGKWIDCNDALVETLGYNSHEEIMGTPVASVYEHPEERETFLKRVKREGFVKEHHLKFKRRDGTILEALVTIVPLKNPDGSLKVFVGTVRDITEHQRMVRALRESETRYRHIFESFEDLYYQTDLNGTITLLSPSLYRLTGWKPEELVGKPATVLYINPDDRTTLLEEITRIGYVRDYELLLLKRDGTRTTASLSASRIYHDDGSPAGIAGILRDISGRKQTENAFKESEERFRSIVEYSLEAILILDFDGKILFANNAAARTVELDHYAGMVGRNVMAYIAPESKDDVIKDFIQVSQGHDAYVAHYHVISARGNAIFIECIGKVITYQGKPADLISIRDITGQKRMAVRPPGLEPFDPGRAQNLLDYIIVYSQEGKILYVNPAAARALGFTAEEMDGTPFVSYVAEESHERVSAGMAALDERREVPLFEIELVARDGLRRSVIVKGKPVQYDTSPATLLFLIDITRRKELEDQLTKRAHELQRISAELEQANKQLTILSTITRHDINNQLTVLTGYLSLLEPEQPDPRLTGYCRKAGDAAERISAMIRFSRDYEKIGAQAPDWQDLQDMVKDAIKGAPLGQVRGVNDLPAGREVLADPLIAKVMYNLMDNAVRYGGKITTIRFFMQEAGDTCTLICEDDGDGVASAEKEKIFERGFGKNTGLGLAVSREILAITGITIRETGEPGKGARFEIAIPEGVYRFTGNDESLYDREK
ncbi:PAS domain S-box protein [uncultured Methanoregula sp.]|uniref:PAS domain S-box protein n=1 Tax=uncultured Methanoregula sp. TaxID=1005933 RepID=UPI002AAB5374|nr:PAS domain S-box protein [uncultured Methanoregula sp.]